MRKTLFKILSLYAIALLMLLLVIFVFGGGKVLYGFVFEAVNEGSLEYIRWLGVGITLTITFIFMVLGHIYAKKRNRNPVLWVFLCALFNLWAFLFLYFSKPKPS